MRVENGSQQFRLRRSSGYAKVEGRSKQTVRTFQNVLGAYPANRLVLDSRLGRVVFVDQIVKEVRLSDVNGRGHEELKGVIGIYTRVMSILYSCSYIDAGRFDKALESARNTWSQFQNCAIAKEQQELFGGYNYRSTSRALFRGQSNLFVWHIMINHVFH